MANGHGGKRRGSGRKPGAATRVTREIADRLASEGLTPLELMISLMRQYHAEGKLCLALDAAVKAAPYVHPRLQAIQLEGGESPVRLEYVVEIVEAAPSNGECRMGNGE